MAEEVKVNTIEEILENTTIADVYKAAKQLDGVAKKTKLIESPFFSDLCGNNVYLKPENIQFTGAYKVRGSYYKISTLTDEERSKGFITAFVPSLIILLVSGSIFASVVEGTCFMHTTIFIFRPLSPFVLLFHTAF